MKFKEEYKPFLYVLAGFLIFYFLPVDWIEFQEAVLSSLRLARWYAREHVVLCLLPAFLIAGAIAAFLKRDAVIKYLGPAANKFIAYPVASVSGSIMAVCSCTVLPLFAGIYKTGAGIGPATAFLYSGPAINILAIVLTAQVLGLRLGVARAVGAVVFSLVVGLLMHLFFGQKKSDAEAKNFQSAPDGETQPVWQKVIFFGLMVLILVFSTWGTPGDQAAPFWHIVHAYRWYITALLAVGLGTVLVGWFEFEPWKFGLTALVVAGGAYIVPGVPELSFGLGVLTLSIAAASSGGDLEDWIEESWGFAKLIMPLLLAGVLVAGIFFGMPGEDGGLIPPGWVANLVGQNTLLSNFLAAVAGALMYFATLTEIPILKGLLDSGMAEGPALSLLLAGPAVSLPNLLVIYSVLGTKKTAAFFIIVVVMSAFAGFSYGLIF